MHGVRAGFATWLVFVTTASLVAPTAAGGELEDLLARRAPSIVWVTPAGSPDAHVLGAIVDPRGVVVFSAAPAARRPWFAGTPGSASLIAARADEGRLFPADEIRVLVVGDPEPRPATLVLLDPVTDLAFFYLDHASTTSLPAISFRPKDAPRLGEELWVVERVAPTWGSAPVLRPVRVTGRLASPAPAWIVAARTAGQGLPAFRRDGRAVGLLVRFRAKGIAPPLDLLLPARRLRLLVESAVRRGAVLREARRWRAKAKPGSVLAAALAGELPRSRVELSDQLWRSYGALRRGDLEDAGRARQLLAKLAAAGPRPGAAPTVPTPAATAEAAAAKDAAARAAAKAATAATATAKATAKAKATAAKAAAAKAAAAKAGAPAAPSAGSGGTESASSAGLRWLAQHQLSDGRWSAAGFSAACGVEPCSGPDVRSASGRGPGAGDPDLDVAVTGLSLLAFLGAGHTHRYSSRREFRLSVKRGLHFLKRTASSVDGQLGAVLNRYAVLNHAIGTFALCEAYAMSRDFTLKRPATHAVAWLLAHQNKDGGWGERAGRSDTFTTGWSVLALRSAQGGRLPAPDRAFRDARAWFDRVTIDKPHGGSPAGSVGLFRAGDGGATLDRARLAATLRRRAADLPAFAPVPNTTAIATLGRVLAGESRRAPGVVRGLEILDASRPALGADARSVVPRSRADFVYWYFGTYAMFQGTRALTPPSRWQRWNRALQKALIGGGSTGQRFGGEEDGSWDPVGAWGPLFGRVGTTALAELTLEIYYRYERLAEERR